MAVEVSTKPADKPKKKFMEAEVSVTEETPNGETLVDASTEKHEMEGLDVAENENAEVEFGLTTIIPTGEFTNIRVHVGAKCRCEGDTDMMDAVFDGLKDWVDTKLTNVVEELTS